MARRRDSKGRFISKRKSRKSRSKKRSGRKTCKTVTICKKRRKICWQGGQIVSNSPAGGSSKRKSSKKKSSSSKGRWVRVSKNKATYSSGKKKGKLKPGCKFTKGGTFCRKGR